MAMLNNQPLTSIKWEDLCQLRSLSVGPTDFPVSPVLGWDPPRSELHSPGGRKSTNETWKSWNLSLLADYVNMSIISTLESYFGWTSCGKFIIDWNVKLVAFAVAIFPFIHRKSNVGLLERRALACLSMSQYLPMSFNIGKRAIHRTFRFDHLQFQLFRCHLTLSCKLFISYPSSAQCRVCPPALVKPLQSPGNGFPMLSYALWFVALWPM